MERELKGLQNSECFEVEVLPNEANPIPLKWIFTVKTDLLRNLVCYKARLVAGGHRPIEGLISQKLLVLLFHGTLLDFS